MGRTRGKRGKREPARRLVTPINPGAGGYLRADGRQPARAHHWVGGVVAAAAVVVVGGGGGAGAGAGGGGGGGKKEE